MSTGKSFELEHKSGYARLALYPELNAYHWADIEKSATEILGAIEESKGEPVIVDLSPLDYLGSAQVALVVRVWKAIKAGDGKMVVLVTAPVVNEVLKTAGLASIWTFADTLPAAYEALQLQSDGRPQMSMWLPIVGLVALAGAGAGLAATLMKTQGLDQKVSLYLQLGCSAVAFVAGLVTIIRGTGAKRGLGVSMVVISVLLAFVEVLKAPK